MAAFIARILSYRPADVIFFAGVTWLSAASFSSAHALDSSRYREDKNIYLLGEVGSAVVPIYTRGFSAGVLVDPLLSIEFTYAEGTKNVTYAEMDAKLYSLKFKRYFTDSFYANAGLAYRDVADRTTDEVSEHFHIQRRGRSAGVDLSIGNRWQYDAVTVGIDWLGFFHPLTVSRNEEFVAHRGGFAAAGEGGDPGQHGGAQGHGDRLSKHGTFEALRMSLGVSF